MQFTKLFSCILDSTIWQEPPQTKILWITMLAMSDRNGEVHASMPGLAKRAGITLQECEAGIACLKAPDPYSRTRDHEGRRVGVIDGGWCLLNHAKYRALLSAEERREYNRKKQAEHRAKTKASANVNDSQSLSAMSAHTESESESDKAIPPISPKGEDLPSLALIEAKTKRKRADDPLPDLPASIDTPAMRDAWGRWLAARNAAKKPVRAPGASQCFADFQRWGIAGAIDSINESIRNGYQGLFEPKGRQYQNPAGIPVAMFIQPEPPGWRAIIDREFPKSELAGITTPWAKLTKSDRNSIAEAIKPYLR